ncbi:MAG: aminotransferase class III-fold pyridoxal phosphate-dependent enzyme, partial [Actinomycetota bacterium]|nr:aminotransferase class III-fold pyridoxal phosphate-dependent enzyme [Actinomycetota bacterium]
PIVGDVRGKGLMIGIEVVEPETGALDAAAARAVQADALRRGLIVELGGRHDSVVRLMPPLNVSTETMDAALSILEESFRQVGRRHGLGRDRA